MEIVGADRTPAHTPPAFAQIEHLSSTIALSNIATPHLSTPAPRVAR